MTTTPKPTKTVLVIGSEGGLGQAVCALWKKQGFHVYGVDLSEKPKVAGLADYLSFDIANLDHSRLQDWLTREELKLDQVIHCAAGGYFGSFLEQKNISQLIELNLTAPIKLTQALEPFMKLQGQLIMIGSVAAHMPTPDYAVYSATKLALESFVQSYRFEVEDRFQVKLYSPGAIRTSFHSKVGFTPTDKQTTKFATPQSEALRLWSFSQKRSWRGGIVALTPLVLLDRFAPWVMDRAMKVKKVQ